MFATHPKILTFFATRVAGKDKVNHKPIVSTLTRTTKYLIMTPEPNDDALASSLPIYIHSRSFAFQDIPANVSPLPPLKPLFIAKNASMSFLSMKSLLPWPSNKI